MLLAFPLDLHYIYRLIYKMMSLWNWVLMSKNKVCLSIVFSKSSFVSLNSIYNFLFMGLLYSLLHLFLSILLHLLLVNGIFSSIPRSVIHNWFKQSRMVSFLLDVKRRFSSLISKKKKKKKHERLGGIFFFK